MAYLWGSVEAEADKELLKEGMQRLFGEKRGEEMTSAVDVGN
jgi:hypothetical protein